MQKIGDGLLERQAILCQAPSPLQSNHRGKARLKFEPENREPRKPQKFP
jgi:hypothetical protein